jgi:alpha-ketoglutarate-dependent taurine dioxygenase
MRWWRLNCVPQAVFDLSQAKHQHDENHEEFAVDGFAANGNMVGRERNEAVWHTRVVAKER